MGILGECTIGFQAPSGKLSPFTPDSAESKIDKFSEITNWVKLKNKQHRSKVPLNSFPVNGHT